MIAQKSAVQPATTKVLRSQVSRSRSSKIVRYASNEISDGIRFGGYWNMLEVSTDDTNIQ
jgi:hypothetical protein